MGSIKPPQLYSLYRSLKNNLCLGQKRRIYGKRVPGVKKGVLFNFI